MGIGGVREEDAKNRGDANPVSESCSENTLDKTAFK